MMPIFSEGEIAGYKVEMCKSKTTNQTDTITKH